jgi:putative RNA 2'-phosphotransferase
MTPRQHMQQFSRILAYVLERHPDEFALVPDSDGFVSIKELLKAFSETEGWRHIRRSHFNELMLIEPDPPVEIVENRIRAKRRDQLPLPLPCENPPRLLYTAIRKKAYPAVREKGLRATKDAPVMCSADPQVAERLGKRKENQPVVLTVHTSKTAASGVTFTRLGEHLYLAETIPAEAFTGPAMPKMQETADDSKTRDSLEEYRRKARAGSYTVDPRDLAAPPEPKAPDKGRKKQISWKQERKEKRRR